MALKLAGALCVFMVGWVFVALACFMVFLGEALEAFFVYSVGLTAMGGGVFLFTRAFLEGAIVRVQ